MDKTDLVAEQIHKVTPSSFCLEEHGLKGLMKYGRLQKNLNKKPLYCISVLCSRYWLLKNQVWDLEMVSTAFKEGRPIALKESVMCFSAQKVVILVIQIYSISFWDKIVKQNAFALLHVLQPHYSPCLTCRVCLETFFQRLAKARDMLLLG